jgi:transcriptional regulator with XRE-family HTH domain
MQAGPGPTLRRRQLGRMLRTMRLEARRKPEEVADYLGVQRPTITRIEQGKQAILPRNVRLMCQLYGVGAPLMDTLLRLAEEAGERGWWVAYSDTMPDWFADYVGLEGDAEEIWSYESEFVPGLLQVCGYIEALAEVGVANEPDMDVAQFVEFRKARQERLDSDRPPRLHFIVNEAALLRATGGHAVMAGQLSHLRAMALRPNITLQVLELEAGAHAAMSGAFSMLRFPDDLEMNVVYLEHERGAGYLERPTDLEHYGRVFGQVGRAALSPENTLTHLTSLEAEHIRANERGMR